MELVDLQGLAAHPRTTGLGRRDPDVARLDVPIGVGADPARTTAFTIAVWMTVAAIMLVIGIVARLYVRYPLYALPAVSLGAGILLARLVRWGRWGTVAAVGLLTISVVSLAFFWYSRIVYDWKLPV